jgi:hypothetical protein
MRTLRVLGTTALAGVCCAVSAAPASAAERPGTDRRELGYDVSHPQCDAELPERADFVVVGVNGGLATRPNRCLVQQLEWAQDATGTDGGRPAVQVYLNTANPGELRQLVTTWPTDGDTPYGECTGDNGTACSYAYGRARAAFSVEEFFAPAARAAGLDDDPAGVRWWLDVETMNTWQSGSEQARDRNRAALEGMADELDSLGAEVGLYSTGYQWRQIVGEVEQDSPLYELDSWLAGARSRQDAGRRCDDEPLTGGGSVLMVQYVADDLDHDVSCPTGRED